MDLTLTEDAVAKLDLPASTRTRLVAEGLPAKLQLPEWPGPTLFTAEIKGETLGSTSDSDALISRDGAHESYIIGSVRETQGTMTTPYSVFALRRGTGEVYLLDFEDPDQDRFVNSTLDAFLDSMQAFQTGWLHFLTDGPERGAIVRSFRELLRTLDPRALDNNENYWPGWLEEIEEQAN